MVLPSGILFLPQMNANQRKLFEIGLPSATVLGSLTLICG
ncbi:MAG: hypothetical protein [Olavius algarvensis Gamma 1 endosymbiont]|nr:MAG: hypothetical protein [Olavius algarvensis Gamma 1 endosymbiont]